ncbi:MAG: GspH/FimT family pseudopilin [Gammaproteobacteria bacterium]|nr:GspH/FimT family pseudopilin [Gammaproteobacteria bacterium]
MRMTTNKGFTLLELLVVITILAFISTLAGVNLHGGDRSDLESVARTLVTDLRYVRSRAMVGNVDTEITIDPSSGSYYSRNAEIDRPLPESISVELTVDLRDTDGERGRIVFYPDGSSSGGEVLLSRNGRRLGVTTAWLNGYVSIQE